MSRCVILSAGPVDDPSALSKLLLPDDYLIAADGGLRLAALLRVTPHMVIADFDSCEETVLPESVSLVRLPVRKDVTDTAAAVQAGRDAGYRDFLLLGGTGGRLDHQYANTQLLVTLARDGCRAVLADERNRIEAVTVSPVVIDPLPGWHVSFFAFDSTVHSLTVRNAAYELSAYDLTPVDPLCISNHTMDKPCEISFLDGTLLVFHSKD